MQIRTILSLVSLISLTTLEAAAPRPLPARLPSRLIPADLPGQQADGSVLLPNLWSLRPVGKQVPLGDFPVNIAVDPAGRFAAVLHCGYGQHEIVIVDLAKAKVRTRVALDEAFYGLAFSPDGTRLYCSGAGDEVIHSLAFRDGFLSDHRELALRKVEDRGIPAGLAIHRDGQRMWVANVLGHTISELNPATGEAAPEIQLRDHAATVVTAKPPTDPDLAAATKREEAKLDPVSPNDPFPYACLVDEPRRRLYVSYWALARVAVFDLASRRLSATWATEEHPNEMLLSPSGKVLFVANANRNTVSLLDAETGRAMETLSAALYSLSPPGSTPNGLAISPDGAVLFVANACNNNIAVFDVSQPGRSRSLGFIPVGWYPTSVRVTPDGKRLLVANGKGLSSKPNRLGPQPGRRSPPSTVQEYIGGLFHGTLSVIDLPAREKLEEQLKEWTARAYRCSPLQSDFNPTGTARRSKDNPIPARVGGASPIRYVLYIIKENRTYDQVLGDLAQGNGDASLCLFPDEVTPNHHALAREFVLLDNFYVESEVSADGHEWSMGAYASDFVEKSWPMSYGHNQRGKYTYPSEGRVRIAAPAEGYLWDRAAAAGVSFRSYGEFVENATKPGAPATARLASLQGRFDPEFHGWDLDYPDVKRAERFISELRRFEKAGDMPRLQILRLPNDHTSGTTAGKLTPRAMVADNDLALGRVVEAVSQSRFWPRTAIFVVEDDAQNGPDHVDAHRTVAYAISPFTKRAYVDSTMYTTSSMLRTMELILGLKPMSQFDAAATPMFNSFQARSNLKPYRTRPVTVDLNERNTKLAWGAEQSAQMDFAKEDAADDLLLNEVVWRSVRGADSPMPAPVRAAFVFASSDDDD